MSDTANTMDRPAAGWRLKLGVVLFSVSIIMPVIGVPLATTLGLSAAVTTSISGGLLVAAEIMGLVAVAVMGKSGYLYIKKRFFGFLKASGPPDEVSSRRYTIGLAMFCTALLFGWVSIYIGKWIPGFTTNPLPYAIGGDILLLSSLFVLGGNFWDKVRSLFVHSAKVQFDGQ
ncbi:MAG: transporter suffix domain-containing protein [Deltaproteobacteria bacterium]|nr:transporter suffix domain-containing protein [Deltaproteobacteria bacterium]